MCLPIWPLNVLYDCSCDKWPPTRTLMMFTSRRKILLSSWQRPFLFFFFKRFRYISRKSQQSGSFPVNSFWRAKEESSTPFSLSLLFLLTPPSWRKKSLSLIKSPLNIFWKASKWHIDHHASISSTADLLKNPPISVYQNEVMNLIEKSSSVLLHFSSDRIVHKMESHTINVSPLRATIILIVFYFSSPSRGVK